MTVTQHSEKSHSERIAEIVAELAEQKRAYFVDGIERPMAVRVTLEAELARLRLEKLQLHSAEKARTMQVRQLRGDLLKKALADLGHVSLYETCNAQAECLIPPVNQR